MGVIENLRVQIHMLKKQLAEKDAMIDWLIEKLVSNHIYFDCTKQFSVKGYTIEANKIVNDAGHCQLWRKAAQEAVNENES